MTKRLFISGAGGRIGEGVINEHFSHGDSNLQLVGINEPKGIEWTLNVYAEKDHAHGKRDWQVEKVGNNALNINGQVIPFFAETNPDKIPFKELGVQILIDASGFYGDPKEEKRAPELIGKPLTAEENGGRIFLKYGIERVVETYPAKTADINIITGVNHLLYNPAKHRVISNASCTTKALSMPLQVLLDNGIGIDALLMDTTHAETGKDLAKLFGLLGSPTVNYDNLKSMMRIATHSTGAAKATGLVIPELKGKMGGMSYRVPAMDGSFANLYFVANSNEDITSDKLNTLLRAAVQNPKYLGRIGVFEENDMETKDIVGRRENGVVVPSKTAVIPLPYGPEGKKAALCLIVSGYDNEHGSQIDPYKVAAYIASKD